MLIATIDQSMLVWSKGGRDTLIRLNHESTAIVTGNVKSQTFLLVLNVKPLATTLYIHVVCNYLLAECGIFWYSFATKMVYGVVEQDEAFKRNQKFVLVHINIHFMYSCACVRACVCACMCVLLRNASKLEGTV